MGRYFWRGVHRWASLLACVVAVVLLVVLLAIALRAFLGLEPGDMSGWVQAIGATATVAAAIWLPLRQDAKRQRREELSKAKRLVLIALEAEAALIRLRQANPTIATTKEYMDRLAAPARAVLPRLDTFLIDEDDPERAGVAHSIRLALTGLESWIADPLRNSDDALDPVLAESSLLDARLRAEQHFRDVTARRSKAPKVE